MIVVLVLIVVEVVMVAVVVVDAVGATLAVVVVDAVGAIVAVVVVVLAAMWSVRGGLDLVAAALEMESRKSDDGARCRSVPLSV